LSETDRFITVDGDNIINEKFLSQIFDLTNHEDAHWNQTIDIEHCVISWSAQNVINGLVYGNGGIKCWPKKKVLEMRTHEHADPNNPHAQVDFCWDLEYIQMNSCYSKIMNNASAQQAWRAGFREGVKMALDRGVKPNTVEDFKRGHWKNLHRLYIWLSVGSDVENGDWAIYGARQGLYKTMCTDWDYINVRDFEYLNNFFIETQEKVENNLAAEIEHLGKLLISELNLPIPTKPLEPEASKFFKCVYQNPSRMSLQLMHVDKDFT
jgi:hypothetical protein